MTKDQRRTNDDIALFFSTIVECTRIQLQFPPATWSAEERLKFEVTRIVGEEALRRLICPFVPDPPKGVAKSTQNR